MPRTRPTLTPLHVLLTTMERRWLAKDESGAAAIAQIAAPYVHARRTAAPAGRTQQEPDSLTDAELEAALREAGAGVALPAEDPEEPTGLG
jgi:hypothetical protein